MARPRAQSLLMAINQRQLDQDRIDNFRVKYTEIQGTIKLNGSGEAAVPVSFAVKFVEKPIVLFGHELEANHSAEEANFPVASGTVLEWDIEEDTPFKKFWVGATVGCVALGKEDMESYIHYSFRGRAYRNPVVDDLDTDDTI